MITQAFDSRTMARMKEALERACLLLPIGGEHSARRMIACKIIECAQRGNTSLSELTEAGYSASLQLTASADRAADHDDRSSGLEHSVHDHG
jgi:hypothetical protein